MDFIVEKVVPFTWRVGVIVNLFPVPAFWFDDVNAPNTELYPSFRPVIGVLVVEANGNAGVNGSVCRIGDFN